MLLDESRERGFVRSGERGFARAHIGGVRGALLGELHRAVLQAHLERGLRALELLEVRACERVDLARRRRVRSSDARERCGDLGAELGAELALLGVECGAQRCVVLLRRRKNSEQRKE